MNRLPKKTFRQGPLGLAFAVSLALASPSLAGGVEAPRGYKLKKAKVAAGNNARIHLLIKVEEGRSKKLAWKVPFDDGEVDRARLVREVKLFDETRAAGFSAVSAKVIESGRSLVKDWVEGPTIGDAILEEPRILENKKDPKTKALIKLFKRMVQKRFLFCDLNPGNIMFENGEWVFVDGNRIEYAESKEAAFRFYQKDFEKRWTYDYGGGEVELNAIRRFFKDYEDEILGN